jgi:hypothetical protein
MLKQSFDGYMTLSRWEKALGFVIKTWTWVEATLFVVKARVRGCEQGRP